MSGLLSRLGMEHPIIQAPMAGTATPAMAAAVSNAGGLGSLGLASAGAEGGRRMIAETQALTNRSINVNLFCHQTCPPDPARDARWIETMRGEFAKFGAEPPAGLRDIYKSFLVDDDMLRVLLDLKPQVVSFHFGLPQKEKIAALKQAGAVLFSSATNLDEARAAEEAGMDAVVAQGFEAGGHRGMFDTAAPDDQLSMAVLTEILAARLSIPVIAAGGIMNGAGIAAALKLGAVAAQLGTAFVGCPESAADEGYRKALASDAALHTTMTAAISGRPARCLANKFTRISDANIAAYPNTYDLGKQLNAAAKARGETGYGAQWAGQGAPLARFLPAAELMAALISELEMSLKEST